MTSTSGMNLETKVMSCKPFIPSEKKTDYFFCELETYPVTRWIYTNSSGRFYIYPKADYIPKMESMPKLEIHGNGKVTFSENITYR